MHTVQKLFYSSQTCISANRILVQSGVYDQFLEQLKETVSKQLVVGDGFDKGVNQGPIINQSQLNKVSFSSFTVMG